MRTLPPTRIEAARPCRLTATAGTRDIPASGAYCRSFASALSPGDRYPREGGEGIVSSMIRQRRARRAQVWLIRSSVAFAASASARVVKLLLRMAAVAPSGLTSMSANSGLPDGVVRDTTRNTVRRIAFPFRTHPGVLGCAPLAAASFRSCPRGSSRFDRSRVNSVRAHRPDSRGPATGVAGADG